MGLVTGTLLVIASISGTKIRLTGQGEMWRIMLSPISQALAVPLILGGIIAGFLSLYAFITTEGVFFGLLCWFAIGVVVAFLIDVPLKRGWDGLVTILGLGSLTAGAWLFVFELV